MLPAIRQTTKYNRSHLCLRSPTTFQTRTFYTETPVLMILKAKLRYPPKLMSSVMKRVPTYIIKLANGRHKAHSKNAFHI